MARSIKKVNGIIGVATLVFSGVVFGQTTVPNIFQAGQPARAAEVNANFDVLEAAIDQNAAAIAQIPAGPEGPQGIQGVQGPQGPAGPTIVVVDKNGVVLGPMLQASPIGTPYNYGLFFFNLGSEYIPLVVYRRFLGWVGPADDLWFDEVNCGGNAFVRPPPSNDAMRFSERLVPDSHFAVLPDNRTITRVNLSQQVTGSLMQSGMKISSSPQTGWVRICFDSVSSFIEFGTVNPMEVIGTLPITAPPYSVSVQ